jgi:hypothetical protein
MSAWVLVLVVMATSLNYDLGQGSKRADTFVGVQTNTYSPTVVTIDFSDKAACETAAKSLQDADGFGTTKALCIARQ